MARDGGLYHLVTFAVPGLPVGTALCERCQRVVTVDQFLDEDCVPAPRPAMEVPR